jgi:molecular chaperone Hsp33
VLGRLFHEDGVEVLGERPLRFACSCSRERVASMLQSLGEEEARAAAAAADGEARIRCEFCGEQYRFGLGEIAALFPSRPATVPAPERLQ